MDEPTKTEKSRDKVRAHLKASGKDPDKFMPKVPPKDPESQTAGAASSTDTQKTAEDIETEKQETESRAAEAKKAEDATKAEEAKQLLDTKDEDLSDEQKVKKQELITLQETERVAEKDSKVQKRIDELVGEIKSLKHKDGQSSKRVEELQEQVKGLQSSFERDPEKENAEIQRLETERLAKFATEDEGKPREQRRELSKPELEEWIVDDIAAAQEWLARREVRRDKDRTRDQAQMGKNAGDAEANAKADQIIKKQGESKARVMVNHPELDVKGRMAELKAEGKDLKEIQEIIWKENPKAKLAAEILKEDPEKYMLAENGPELIAAEIEKRMGKKSTAESEEDKETRLREEGAEAERQRQAGIDAGKTNRGGGQRNSQVDEGTDMYKQQFGIFKKMFPNETDAQVKARLDKRLKERRNVGAA